MLLDFIGDVAGAIGAFAWMFICLGIVIAIFIIIIGAIFYFSTFDGKNGRKMMINGVVLVFVLCLLYMAVFRTGTPPEISQFFSI
ncbi:MAG: hypothetical protein ACTSUE_12535 [Promethearchaeota archaeon]